jgi:hypothetical protein
VSHKVSLSSQTDGMGIRVVIASPWNEPAENLRNLQFWRSRLEYYSPSDDSRSPSRINWNAVLGIVITFGVSAGFWTGVGLTVAHIWK